MKIETAEAPKVFTRVVDALNWARRNGYHAAVYSMGFGAKAPTAARLLEIVNRLRGAI